MKHLPGDQGVIPMLIAYLLFELSINIIHQRSGEEGHVKLVIYILL